MRDRWFRLGVRLAVVLAAAALVPACGKEKTILGTAGPEGPAGPSGANPPAPWSEPVNISRQVEIVHDDDAYGQQAVFTPDGRLHVVYFAYDTDGTSEYELFYTSAAPPYSSWDAPVRITENSPMGFDLAPAADGSVNVAFVDESQVELWYACNTASNRRVFTSRRVRTVANLDHITAGSLLMRGNVAHLVWAEYVDQDKYNHLFHSKSTDGWPLSGNPTELAVSDREIGQNCITFTSDPAGNFHLAYKEQIPGEYRYLRYRCMPVGEDSFGNAQEVNDYENEQLSWSYEAPLVQFDGSNNVYVFWRRWYYEGSEPQPSRAMMCNIKSVSSTFQASNATVVTVDSEGNGVPSGEFLPFFDVQVASDGRIHAAWKCDQSYGTMGLYPLYYRTRDPGSLIPYTGWQPAEVAAWLIDPTDSGGYGLYDGGMGRSVLLRPAADGTVHVFYSDVERFPGDYCGNLQHAYRSPGTYTWYNTGSLSNPTLYSRYQINGGAYCYFLEAGIEEDGCPFSLFAANPSTWYLMNGDLAYTHLWAGSWAVGLDVNGPNHAETYGNFWVGRDPQGRLHAIWQQEVDPFENPSYYDLMHSHSPVSSDSFWMNEQVHETGNTV